MAARRTDRAVAKLRDLAREQSSIPGPEQYGIDPRTWAQLAEWEQRIVLDFAATLRAIRLMEQDLVNLFVDHVHELATELARQVAEMRADRQARATSGVIAPPPSGG